MSKINFKILWPQMWMRLAGLNRLGRAACWIAGWFHPPLYGRVALARFGPIGYVSPAALIDHPLLQLNQQCFLSDGVYVYQAPEGGEVSLAKGVHIHRDTTLQTARGGRIAIGNQTHIQSRCNIIAYKGPITIGRKCEIAPHCAFYSYDHGMVPGIFIQDQPKTTRGGIHVGDDVWLGFGVIILDGVRIGNGAVVGAGSVVTQDIQENGIAVGNPARTVKSRHDLAGNATNLFPSKTPT